MDHAADPLCTLTSFTQSIKSQLKNLLQGLYDVVPKKLLHIFTENEIELLISGLPEIDVDDWR